MEDKKQIEEMAKICEECVNLCNECVRNGYCTYNATNKNTANSPEDSVVLTREEYEELINLQRTHAEDLTNAIQSYEESKAELKIEYNNHIKNLEKTIDRQSKDLNSQADRIIDLKIKLENKGKETAREILQKIKEVKTQDCGYTDWLDDTYFGEEYQKLAKQFGVEVE
jgi:Fe-S oxidoreductase